MAEARILVVDDGADEARSLARALARLGHSVTTTGAGAHELDHATRVSAPALAVVRLAPPGEASGVATGGHIRRELGVPVVYFLSGAGNDVPARAADTEPYGYLEAPIRDRQLRTVLEVALQRIERERRLAAAEAEAVPPLRDRYAAVFRASPLPVTVTELATDRVLEVNEAFARLSGWSLADASGRTLLEMGWWVTPRDRVRLVQAVREEGAIADLEVTFSTRRGELRETLVSAEILELDGIEALVTMIHDITERKGFERELRRRALHDPLTGLPNRTLFHDRLEHAIDRTERRGMRVAVLFLDLDGFKAVNDALGHAHGDELLRAVAERVRGCVREGDTFARFGGDEFAAVLEPRVEVAEARAVAERFAAALREPFEVEGVRIPVTASIGITIEGPGNLCPEGLIRAADFAMYRAKELRGTSYRFAEPTETDEACGEVRTMDRTERRKETRGARTRRSREPDSAPGPPLPAEDPDAPGHRPDPPPEPSG